MYLYFYQVFMILSMAVSLFLLVLVWQRRHLPAAPAMISLAVGSFIWTLGFFLEANGNTLAQQLLFGKIGYIGLLIVPPAWLAFSLNYTNVKKFITGWKRVLISVFPFILAILVSTNNLHHLIWYNEHLSASGAFIITVKSYGPFYWVMIIHNYLLVLLGGVIMLRRLFTGSPLFKKQAVFLIIAVVLPVIWNVIYFYNLIPLPRKDLTPMMFAISGLAIVIGVLRYHIFTTVPFAREFIIKQLNDGVFIFDRRNTLVEANPTALAVTGIDNSIIGKKLDELTAASSLFKRIKDAGANNVEITLDAGGKKRIMEIGITPMTIDDNQNVGKLVVLHDITERRKSEEQYRMVTENSADIIYKLNMKDFRYTYVSPSVEGVLGFTDKESINLAVKEVITPESYEKQLRELRKDMADGNFHSTLELDAIHKDGHIVPLEVHCSFVLNEKGEPVEIVGVARDITDRKKMEKQLAMQDRLASIGQLTSSVAHELNNPLTGIINYSSILLKRELPDDIRQDVEAISQEAQRTAYIVKNLLTFTRKQNYEKETVNIIEGIEKVLALHTYEQKVNNVRTVVHADPEMPFVLGNISQLQQVFFNIMINAEYFMLQANKGGTLNISAGKSGNAVRISFKDDGPGISKENLKHIFTPLFTAKEPGKGTGLSLSICQGIINEHGGKIWVESEEGKGADFIIELPAYQEPSAEDEE